jgi:hypothetical protein
VLLKEQSADACRCMKYLLLMMKEVQKRGVCIWKISQLLDIVAMSNCIISIFCNLFIDL